MKHLGSLFFANGVNSNDEMLHERKLSNASLEFGVLYGSICVMQRVLSCGPTLKC